MFFDWTPLLTKGIALLSTAVAAVMLIVGAAIFDELAAQRITVDQIIAIVASIGSCLAAVATYLTVREMRAGRIAASRARLTTPGSDSEFQFVWHRVDNVAPLIPAQRTIIRNASAGVAHNIRALWECAFDVETADVERINAWLTTDQHVEIAGSSVDFYDAATKTSHVVAWKNDTLYLGDLGPSQDVFCTIPTPVLGMVFLKWASLLNLVAHGEHLSYEDVPLVKLALLHDSPYQKDIRDELLIRFELVDHKVVLRTTKELSEAIGGRWKTFEIAVAFETTARSLYDIPKVVVPPGGGHAG